MTGEEGRTEELPQGSVGCGDSHLLNPNEMEPLKLFPLGV